MKLVPALISYAVLSSSLAGCAVEEKEPASCSANVTAKPANNYSFSSTLSFPPVAVQPDTELTFGWSSVMTDFLGHSFDPMADIDSMNVILWKLTQEDLQTKLNADALVQKDLAVIATLDTQQAATSANLFDFTSLGMVVTPDMILPFLDAEGYPPESHTYTAMIATGDELGSGTRMIQTFKLDPSSTNTHVELTPTSTNLDYSVDLQSLEPTPIPAGTADVTIDWADMTVNALGNDFFPTDITGILVAHYSQPMSELEARFLDLNIIATDTWRADVVAGASASFSTLTNADGEPFPGIDGDGTWIVALICRNCRNPAPWYLSTLTPCDK